MAKTCMIAKEKVRQKLSELARVKREELKKLIKATDVSYENQIASVLKLQKMPRDTSPVRVRRRCRSCGRPHGVYRKFALCRVCLRNAAMKGYVPGLVKASW